jgi:hypothetical protein
MKPQEIRKALKMYRAGEDLSASIDSLVDHQNSYRMSPTGIIVQPVRKYQ